jgi:outer membrane protein assembly factor BamB
MSNPSQFVLTAVDGTVTAHLRATGEVAWTYRVPEGKADHRHVTRIYADEHRVVMVAARMNEPGMFATADATAHVCCLEYATGKLLWEHAVKANQVISHFTATLLVEGGQVFVVHAEILVVLALETGKLMWQRRLDRVEERFPVSVSLAVPGLARQGDTWGRR